MSEELSSSTRASAVSEDLSRRYFHKHGLQSSTFDVHGDRIRKGAGHGHVMHIAKISIAKFSAFATVTDRFSTTNKSITTQKSSSHVTATRVGTGTTITHTRMSYNKGEKDFGEGPKVHRIRITLTSRSAWHSPRRIMSQVLTVGQTSSPSRRCAPS